MASIDLDSCSGQAMDPRVLALFVETASRGDLASPFAPGAPGKAAADLIEEARCRVAALVNASPSEIVFTSSGTEANNLAVRGALGAIRARRPAGPVRAVTTDLEHPSVSFPLRTLSSEGVELAFAFAGRDGTVTSEAVAAAASGASFVSVLHTSLENGRSMPIAEISAAARAAGAVFHTDACGIAGRVPVDARALGADLLSLSSRKLGGPGGAGALFVKKGVRIRPMIEGGPEERGLRCGSYCVPAIAAMGLAAKISADEMSARAAAASLIRERIVSLLKMSGLDFFVVAGAETGAPPFFLSIVLPGANFETVSGRLASASIFVSQASWCVASASKVPAALSSLGLGLAEAEGYLRVCVGPGCSESAAGEFVSALSRAAGAAR